jgi:hypothetical protein
MTRSATSGGSTDAPIFPAEGGGGGSDLIIACRMLETPRGECSYCERPGEYLTRNGADPDFEAVCGYHAGQFLMAAGASLLPRP